MGKKAKFGEIEVDITDLGFSETDEPTPEQVVQAFGTTAKQIKTWKREAEKGQKREKQRIEMEEKHREMECDLLLNDAVKCFKIAPYQRDFYKKVYKSSMTMAALVREHIADMEEQSYLTEEQGLSGDTEGPSDPRVELAVRSAQKIANNPKISQVEAEQLILREDHSLNDRIRTFQLKEKEVDRGNGRG